MSIPTQRSPLRRTILRASLRACKLPSSLRGVRTACWRRLIWRLETTCRRAGSSRARTLPLLFPPSVFKIPRTGKNMFSSSPIIVGLDIGTSKICAVIGEIVNANAAAEDIRNAIVEAEQTADTEVRSVYLGVTGGHMRGFNNRGFHPLASD